MRIWGGGVAVIALVNVGVLLEREREGYHPRLVDGFANLTHFLRLMRQVAVG